LTILQIYEENKDSETIFLSILWSDDLSYSSTQRRLYFTPTPLQKKQLAMPMLNLIMIKHTVFSFACVCATSEESVIAYLQ